MPVDWNRAAIARVADSAETGLRRAAEQLLEESNKLAPRDESDLAGSGSVAVDGDEAAVGYRSPYAVRQHEKLWYRHPVGEAKYLENALRNNQSEIADTIADAIREALR